MDVRRLAAIDMYGTRGTVRRRRIILVEFLFAVVVMPVLGVVFLIVSDGGTGRLFGAWLIGSGLNYLPLALYAIRLSRPGALDAELAGVEIRPELRRYSLLQLWIMVPLALVGFAARDAAARRT